MITSIKNLPTALTSYAYRAEYIHELEGMVPTIKEHHPNWPIVTGKGPVDGFAMPTLEVESPTGKCHWSLPVPLNLNGSKEASEEDWAKVALMKPWWIAEVWRNLGKLTEWTHRRLVWLDADARLNGPLDIELDSGAEVIAAPWWMREGTPPEEQHLCGGLVILQGAPGGIVDTIVNQWAQQCVSYIEHLPPLPPPDRPDLARDDDQKVLTGLLKQASHTNLICLKLDYDKYCGVPDLKSGKPKAGALVDQWMMNEKMRLPQDRDRNWPPPEQARRQPAKMNS